MLITNNIFIACAAKKAWEATVDIDNWPVWAPTVQTARRLDKLHFGIGSQACIKQPMQSQKIWTVTDIEFGRFFTWETSGRALVMQATHRVASQDGGTKCTLTIKLVGPLSAIYGIFLTPVIWLTLMQENRGLKRWCENGTAPSFTQKNHAIDKSESTKLNKG